MTSEFRAASRSSLSVRPVALAAALCAFSLLPTAAAAQSSAAHTTAAAASLPSVVVTATRTPVRADQTVADVTVLTRDDLERATGRTLSEVLSQQGGIQLSANGGLGKTSSVFIRGLEARHVLLLVDGVRYGSATTGTPELDNLPLGDIDRIEIVRGPLSSLYGSDAVGGVVQVFTRRASASEGTRANGAITAGSHRYGQASGGLSFNDGVWSGAVQALHTENRGFSATNPQAEFGSHNADTDGFRQNAASAHLGLKLPQGWQVGAHLLNADAVSGYDDGAGADAKAGLRTRVMSVDASGAVTAGWRTQLRVARSANDYETIASASPYADLGTIATVQQQLSWDNTFSLPVGTLLVVAEHLKQKVTKPAGNYDITNRTVNSLALGYHATVGVHTVQASLRHDRNSQYGNPTTGTIGYGLALMDGLRATAQVGTSFVAPSFNQLYWPSYGNPLLAPEKGKHAEVGLRYTTGEQQLSATVFSNRIRGYITQGANPVNLPYAQSNGVSLGYDGQLGLFKVGAALDHLTPKNDTDGSTNQGNLLPRRARNAAKLSADVDLGAWTVGAGLQAYSHRFNNTANTQRLAGYATVDLHAQWQFERDWALGARLNNAANRAYETALGYNQPGRELYVTLRYAPR
ncbi:TonB-dependent receptor domain-containing protein [Sphaerotilus sp.]|uniref:TonB-dependent receptor domain-containing protein n=1 Tax=Sphaerotilus sp. TaxID=2093942 RepID=UPI002ACE8EE0|nr:TonB-dependent receptor [Sphaerotilus sp.]MDZ7856243.1 TonB-dependent receptor [Sphaerotilus sp.]